ncbi:hypothetical protein WMF30_09355 [Sorangium sp. So ce134]
MRARNARAQAFGPAWKAYRGFKRLVRDALGASSRRTAASTCGAAPGCLMPETARTRDGEEAPPPSAG